MVLYVSYSAFKSVRQSRRKAHWWSQKINLSDKKLQLEDVTITGDGWNYSFDYVDGDVKHTALTWKKYEGSDSY